MRESSPGYDLEALSAALEQVVAQCAVEERLARDPVGLVRELVSPQDQEIAGLVAACMAFGNVQALRASIQGVLSRLGPSLGEALDDPKQARRLLAGVGHRMLRADDITRLLLGAREMQREHGSLGRAFAGALGATGDLRAALSHWTKELRQRGGLAATAERRGPAHILPDPGKNSGCKRLLLYLRWMVRREDGVDLGLWQEVSPALLLIPVDIHIHRLARNLGITQRRAASWATAEEITAVLRRINPLDPVRFDFALCHLGMAQGCPERRDEKVCPGCGVQKVCRYWRER